MPDFYPDFDYEKARYDHHDPDVFNPGYRRFVSPVVNEVVSRLNKESNGLDFGSGNGPVVSVMLQELGYHIVQYDPFYAPDKSVLEYRYDYVVCCEVMEHFHRPKEEFERLLQLLNPEGVLVCMTHIYRPDIDFASWYYKNDKTHVFFYTPESIEYISKAFGFRRVEIKERVIVFTV